MKNQPNSQNSIPPDILLCGARTVTVRNRLGRVEEVDVRVILWSEVPAFFKGINEDTALVALVTRKPMTWVDALDVESMDAIITTALEINHPILAAYADRKRKLAGAAVNYVLPVAAQIQKESAALLQSLVGSAFPSEKPPASSAE